MYVKKYENSSLYQTERAVNDALTITYKILKKKKKILKWFNFSLK